MGSTGLGLVCSLKGVQRRDGMGFYGYNNSMKNWSEGSGRLAKDIPNWWRIHFQQTDHPLAWALRLCGTSCCLVEHLLAATMPSCVSRRVGSGHQSYQQFAEVGWFYPDCQQKSPVGLNNRAVMVWVKNGELFCSRLVAYFLEGMAT
jgi:hypothetical protein